MLVRLVVWTVRWLWKLVYVPRPPTMLEQMVVETIEEGGEQEHTEMVFGIFGGQIAYEIWCDGHNAPASRTRLIQAYENRKQRLMLDRAIGP